MNKLGDLLAKKSKQEEEKLNSLKEEIRKEVETEIENRVREELQKEYENKSENINREEIEKELRVKIEEQVKQELKNEVVVVEKEEKAESSLLSASLKAEVDKKLKIFDDIEDLEIRNYLKIKSSELLIRGFDYALNVGRIGQEVFDELGRKGSPEGLYTKWVQLNGFSESTMKRYRNRWEVYSLVHESVKPFILLLSHQQIKEILRDEAIKELICSADNITFEDIKNLLEDEKQEKLPKQPKEVEFPKEFNMDNFNSFLSNADKLEEVKKQKFYKLLEEITKLMNESL